MKIILHVLMNAIVLLLMPRLLSGVHVSNFSSAFIAAVILALMNLMIRPVLLLVTLPVNILTFGFFTFVVNALILLIVSMLSPGFVLDTFGWALLASLVMTFINYLIDMFDGMTDDKSLAS